MSLNPAPDAAGAQSWVSTGRLPPAEVVAAAVRETHERLRANIEGCNAHIYPSLAAMPGELFGVCLIGTDGACHAAGDFERDFTIMSVSKPFVFALLCQAIGPDEAHARLGANATGLPFNALEALERAADGRTNPMVNPGAIAASSLVPGVNRAEKWRTIRDGLSRFAGRALCVDEEVYGCAIAGNSRNQAIARLLQTCGRLDADPVEAIDIYTLQCSLRVTAKDLAVMGATLAAGGVNPLTKERVIDAGICRFALAVMATAGLYETSGDWLYRVGLPGKSGIAGGMVAVAPGKAALGTFSPRLDATGNSVRGQLAARHISERLGLNLFASNAPV
ncbi:MAG TPA: glutaminase A [Xanthobacteraceae bacterium]|nr:glutaminase A [Xanthobacteraceae bacterium]